MKNWSLNAKIGSVIALSVFATFVVSAVSLTKMTQLSDKFLEVTGTLAQREQLTATILDKQREITISGKDLVIEADATKLATLQANLTEQKRALLDDVEKYRKIASDQGRETLKRYDTAIASWFPAMEQVTKLSKEHKTAEADHLIETQEAPARLASLKVIEDLNELTLTAKREAATRVDEIADQTHKLVLTVSIASVLLASLLAILVLRALSRSIDQIISALQDSGNQVTSAAQQIASSSEELSQAATEQASSLEETSASVEEMSSMIKTNSHSARKTAEITTLSNEGALRGKSVVENMINAIEEINGSNGDIMNQINESNRQISEIVKVIGDIGNKTKVINDIVFQTKLLSFNASVEAARAGEHGKGFAVVAEEVGKLAQMSGNAAKEISEMLDGSIQKVERIVNETKTKVEHLITAGRDKVDAGSRIAQECGEVLDEIVRNASTVSQMAEDIAKASNEQSQGIQEITRAMSQLDQVTQQNAASSEEAASASEELAAQATALKGVVGALVAAVKGGSGGGDVDLYQASKTGPAVTHSAKVLTFKGSKKRITSVVEARAESTSHELKRAVGLDVVPSESDPRFNEA